MTIIEKLARAMIGAVNPERNWHLNPYYTLEKDHYEFLARAALTALLEPSEGMIKAGGDAGGYNGYDDTDNTAAILRAAIQHALDEKEG